MKVLDVKTKKKTKKEVDYGLIEEAQNGNEHSLHELVDRYTNLIWKIVHKFSYTGRQREELYQEGVESFIKGVYRFKLDKGVAVSTYMYPVIFGGIRKYLLDSPTIGQCRAPRVIVVTAAKIKEHGLDNASTEEIMDVLGIEVPSLARDSRQYVQDKNGGSSSMDATLIYGEEGSEETLGNLIDGDVNGPSWEDAVILREVISKLRERGREVIKMRYYSDMSQKEIAEIYNVSKTTISNIERQSLVELKGLLGGRR